jgi:transketolase
MKIDMRDAFFERLTEIARDNDQIVVLSADHAAFALTQFEKEMPERYINVGIAEQNMVGVAAGLAASGKIVFVYGISPFVSLRVLEQLTIDVAAMQLPVNVVSVGAGFTYSTDGPTHQGLQDLSAVLTIPGMTILNSSDPENTRAFVDIAVSSRKPHYIRIEKEKLSNFKRIDTTESFLECGFSVLEEGNTQILLISSGAISHDALEAARFCHERLGLEPRVLDLHQLKPIKKGFMGEEIDRASVIFTVEEGYVSGLGQAISRLCTSRKWRGDLFTLGVEETYVFKSSTREDLKFQLTLDASGIFEFIKANL